MSIKAQKIIMYIPVVNIFTTYFCLMKECSSKHNISGRWIFKKIIIFMAVFVGIMATSSVLRTLIKNDMVGNILFALSVFVALFVLSKLMISAQVELANSPNKSV